MISWAAKRTIQVVVAGVGLFLMLGAIVASTYIHGCRLDLSPGDRFTLSDHALRILRELERPVRLTAFIRTEDGRNPVIKDLLWQARNESRFVTYDVVDINKNPALASQFGVQAYGAVVVESEGKRRDFTNPTEAQFISAILNVSGPSKRVGVVTGHGECVLNDVNRRVGCSELRSAILQESYELVELPLASVGEVPEDVDVLLVNGPAKDFLELELAALGRFLEAGGKLLVLLDPFRAPGLASLLRSYGIIMSDNVVLDPENALAGGEPLSFVITDVNRQHLIASSLQAPPLLVGMRAVSAEVEDDDEAVDLLRTGPRSWASHDPQVLEGAPARFVAGRDRNGPFRVALEVRRATTAPEGERRGAFTTIVAVGDSDFVSNRFLGYLGNQDFILNAINWLAREERLIGPRPPRKEPGTKQLFISQSEVEHLFWWAVVVMPGTFLLAGVAVLVWRRLGP